MASISFGGLASGINTDAIVKAIMDVERQPINRLNTDKSYLDTRLSAFSDFDGKLKGLLNAFEDIDTSKEFRSYSATPANEDFFTVSTTSSANAGSFNIEVVNLAQIQKDVSVGYAGSSEGNFSAGSININGTDITVDAGDSLGGIVDKINQANTGDTATGVSAALINDGTDNGFRIVLTGEDASTNFTATASGVSADGTALSFSNTQTAQQATVIIDGITIVSDNNTLTGAIPGATLTLLQPNTPGETTHLGIDVNTEGVKEKIDAFVTAYNDIITFIGEQKETGWRNDNGLTAVQRRMRNLLVSAVGGTGEFQHLVDIGFSTNQSTGMLEVDSTKLNEAILNDMESMEKLFIGEDGVEGIASKFTSYLESMTDSSNGLYASRKKSTDNSVRSIENHINRMELRLEKREQTLREQFYSLELLMSAMNSTSSYLAQQMDMLSNLTSGGK
ncbi:MAG: flagellar filament capping protein FliD [Desulfobulbaceae bacterium]|nr:flagellar filament capping protein FliD [Desulfobulbaceae bacterium]